MIQSNHRELREGIKREGYAGPIRFLSNKQCRRICKLIKKDRVAPRDWGKGRAVTSRLFYDLATLEPVIDAASSLLEGNVAFWGASIVTREPGQQHVWHTDIETAQSNGKAITVWIGLKHTNARSSLSFIPGSHQFESSIQEEASRWKETREDIDDELILQWSRIRSPESEIIRLDMEDGEGILFDGRLWHGSFNRNRLFTRQAILLQYATPETPIRIPDFNSLQWPFHFNSAPKPPTIMVSGQGENSVNHLVSPPASKGTDQHRLSTFLRPLGLPLREDSKSGWRPYSLFRGFTSGLAELSCHMSILTRGSTPHKPHGHPEEELLIMLSGKAELKFEEAKSASFQTHTLKPGSLIYYPRRVKHTLTAIGPTPATYLMFKWRGQIDKSKSGLLETSVHRFEPESSEAGSESRSFRTRLIFEGETNWLRRLHCHITELDPGAGYAPHADAYDVAILLLSGEIETLGEQIGEDGVVFYAAGEAHGMKNVGESVARYLVFEFHPRPEDFLNRSSLALSDLKRNLLRRAARFLRRHPSLKHLVKTALGRLRT